MQNSGNEPWFGALIRCHLVKFVQFGAQHLRKVIMAFEWIRGAFDGINYQGRLCKCDMSMHPGKLFKKAYMIQWIGHPKHISSARLSRIRGNIYKI